MRFNSFGEIVHVISKDSVRALWRNNRRRKANAEEEINERNAMRFE